MQLSDFNYTLPNELIARFPTQQRVQSRLLCANPQTQGIEHKHFYDLIDQLEPHDLLVMNNTRVIPARMFGQKVSGGKVEILVERLLDEHTVLAHVKVSKALKPGGKVLLDQDKAFVMQERQGDLFVLKVDGDEKALDVIESLGHMPLPPYINRPDESTDQERYQTVYADPKGSVAAPTAGLHFDDELLDKIRAKGIETVFVTLHVGAGTFQPVRVENILEHQMHAEYLEVSDEVCAKIRETRSNGGRVVAVGTTTVRSLETAALSGELKPFFGDSKIFIYPGFKFQVVDVMITNFHLPKSSLLMLVSAFIGHEFMHHIYQTAIEEKYRFYSYGDAMVVGRTEAYRYS